MATRRRLGGKVLTKKVLTVEGIPEIVANAKRLMRDCGYQGADVASELKHAFMAGALILRDECRDLVPVDTGLLKLSIFAAYGAKDKADVLVGVNTRQAVRTSGGQTRTYAGVVEFGGTAYGRPQAPHPYMRPGIAAARPTVARVMKEALLAAVDKLAARAGIK